MEPLMLRLLASSVTVAKRAGSEVRRIMKSGKLDIVDKGIKDYQTEADRIAQRLIVSSLSKKYPQCTIVGEEDLEDNPEEDERLFVDNLDDDVLRNKLPSEYEKIEEKDITIWVDPLDGTTEFVKGFYQHVTVLIGISVGGRATAGVIHQPFYGDDEGRTIWSLIGLGCFGVTPSIHGSEKLIVATTASHGNKTIEDAISAVSPDEVIKVGGAGYKVLMVIEGKAHSYVFTSNGCKKWDTCAPEAALISMGGVLTNSFNDRLEYLHREDANYQNDLGIIASINKEIHSKIISKIPQQVKDALTLAKSKY